MKLNEINVSQYTPIKKKCLYFSQSEANKVVKGFKELYSLKDITNNDKYSNIYIELEYFYNEIDYIILWEDYSFICNNIGKLQAENTIDRLITSLDNYKYLSLEGFKNYIQDKENNIEFINLLEIELFALSGDIEKATYYSNYRNEYKHKQLDKEMQEAKERESKRIEEEKQHQEELNKKLLDAEEAIVNHKTIYNEEIEESTLFLMLFKKHNIKVPLKTQGWINKALAKIEYNTTKEKYTYYYYNKQSKNSTVFNDYLQELIQCIAS